MSFYNAIWVSLYISVASQKFNNKDTKTRIALLAFFSFKFCWVNNINSHVSTLIKITVLMMILKTFSISLIYENKRTWRYNERTWFMKMKEAEDIWKN